MNTAVEATSLWWNRRRDGNPFCTAPGGGRTDEVKCSEALSVPPCGLHRYWLLSRVPSPTARRLPAWRPSPNGVPSSRSPRAATAFHLPALRRPWKRAATSAAKTDVNRTGCPRPGIPALRLITGPLGLNFLITPILGGGRAGPGRPRRPYRQSPFHTTLNGPGSSAIYGEFS